MAGFSWSPSEVARAQGAYGGFLDSIKQGLASILPAHTIVGQWASGNNAGAAQAAGNWITQGTKPPAATAISPTLQYRPPGTVAIPGLGNVSQTTLLLAAAGLAGALYFMRRRRR